MTMKPDAKRIRESSMCPEEFLLILVDVVWTTALQDESVPSTEWARRMIARARTEYVRAGDKAK